MAAPSSSWTDVRPSAGLDATSYRAAHAWVIALNGALDGTTCAALDRTISGALADGHRRLVLDLHGLRALEPDAVPVLWAGLRAALRRGGSLRVVGLRPSHRRVIDPLVPHGLGVSSSLYAAALLPDSGPRVPR